MGFQGFSVGISFLGCRVGASSNFLEVLALTVNSAELLSCPRNALHDSFRPAEFSRTMRFALDDRAFALAFEWV